MKIVDKINKVCDEANLKVAASWWNKLDSKQQAYYKAHIHNTNSNDLRSFFTATKKKFDGDVEYLAGLKVKAELNGYNLWIFSSDTKSWYPIKPDGKPDNGEEIPF